MRRAERSIQRRTSRKGRATRREASTEMSKEAAVNLGLAFLGLSGACYDRDRIPPCFYEP